MNLAFLNAVERNGGIITAELCAKFGIDGAKPAVAANSVIDSGYTLAEIPKGWESLNWMKKQAIAKAIDPEFEPDSADRVASIDARIKEEIARRESTLPSGE